MRIKRLDVSVELVKHVLATGVSHPGFQIIRDGIPEDAVICSAELRDGRVLRLTIFSLTFDEINEGQEVPILLPIFETMREASA